MVVFALLVAAAGIGLTINAFSGEPDAREPALPAGTGTIAYVAFDSQTLKWSLFTVEADGSSSARIAIDLPGEAFHPSWSPDGTKLAFDVQSGGDTEIYTATVYGSNGSNLSKLTTTTGWNFLPAWSPDGTRIAYSSAPGPEMGTAIYVIDLLSGQTRAITDLGDLCCPSWRQRPKQVTGEAMPGTCGYGPWIEHCPEASWARLVLREAGYPNVDDAGTVSRSRLQVARGRSTSGR